MISGTAQGVADAASLAKENGAKVIPLQVSGPFHSSLMEPAAQKMKEVLDKIEIRNAEVPVIANVSAKPVEEASVIKENLVKQIYSPVRWEETVNELMALGVDTFIEIGPGKVLSGLVKKVNRRATTIAISDEASMNAAIEKLKGSNSMLNGKTALVTGASRGIGRAIALELAKNGAKVAVNYAGSEAKAKEVVEEIIAMGQEAIAVQANVADSESVTGMVKRVIEEFGSLDILVNNAGITKDNLLMRMKEEEWDSVLNTNLKGVFLCTKAVTRQMMKQRKGRIINISSIVGVSGNPGQANYVAAKAGVIGLTKTTAKELASRNITVNAIAPGFIDTEMTEVLEENVKGEMLKAIPLARFGSTDDIASLVTFLAGDSSSYITGQTINVDGGMVM